MKYAGLLLTIVTFAVVSSSPARGQATAPLMPLSMAEMPAAAGPAAGAPPQATSDDGWRLSLSIPVWLPGIDGDLTVRGRDLSVNTDTSDAVDLFDSHLDGAFAARFEAAKGRAGLLVDLMYIDLRGEGTQGQTNADGSLEGFIGELGAFYTVVAPPPGKRGWGAVRVDALGGLRLSELRIGIHGDAFNGSTGHTIYDPYVGARLTLGLTDWLSFKARGDVGGFGIEAWPTSEPSYNAETGLEFHLAEWLDLGVGYRWLKYDFKGNSSDSGLNATLSGPYITLQFNF